MRNLTLYLHLGMYGFSIADYQAAAATVDKLGYCPHSFTVSAVQDGKTTATYLYNIYIYMYTFLDI